MWTDGQMDERPGADLPFKSVSDFGVGTMDSELEPGFGVGTGF